MKEKLEKIEEILADAPWQTERVARKIEKIVAELKAEATLREEYYLAETIDDKGIYKKYKYRKIERIRFVIRPLRESFIPCKACQEKLKAMMVNGKWILGNRDYAPAIELENSRFEVDDHYQETVEKHKATKEELERIGIEGWENIGKIQNTK